MRNSYRDVAYHCSGKQRNPITGWQLNSLSLSFPFPLSLSEPCFSCGRRSESPSKRPRSRDQPPHAPCSLTPSRSAKTERTSTKDLGDLCSMCFSSRSIAMNARYHGRIYDLGVSREILLEFRIVRSVSGQ